MTALHDVSIVQAAQPVEGGIQAFARRLVDEYPVVSEALPIMLREVLADPDLEREAIAFLLEGACRRLLETAHGDRIREARQDGAGPQHADRRDPNLVAWSSAVAASLMDTFEVRPGLKLGAATRADVSSAAEGWATKAADARIKSRWLRLIAQGLPAGVTVRKHYTETRLLELKQEAAKMREIA